MRIKTLVMTLCLFPFPAFAEDMKDMSAEMQHEHGGGIFHMLRTETDIGADTDGDTIASWDIDGWVGTDENKLWVKVKVHIKMISWKAQKYGHYIATILILSGMHRQASGMILGLNPQHI